jgi:hypothetical protein
MKTTVEINDGLLAEAKKLAKARGITMRQLIEEAIRSVLSANPPKENFVMRDGSVGGDGLVRDMTWEEMRELCYDRNSD